SCPAPPPPPSPALFPYPTLFRSVRGAAVPVAPDLPSCPSPKVLRGLSAPWSRRRSPRRRRATRGYLPLRILSEHLAPTDRHAPRSEEHTSELQSRENLVCRLLLE